MERQISELILPILVKSSKDIRIWRDGHIYYRIDRNVARVVRAEDREDQLYFILTWDDKGRENETEIPMALVKKLTIAKNINIEYSSDYYF